MYNLKKELLLLIKENKIVKITFSSFRKKDEELERVTCSPLKIKNNLHYQFEYRYKRILKHINIKYDDNLKLEKIITVLIENAKDLNILTTDENISCKISKKFKVLINRKQEKNDVVIASQNKIKNYIIDPTSTHDFLIELGIQSKNGKIKNDKYNKFKQINKYLEFLENSIKQISTNKQINILDFGSGKSYLTFSAYHYLNNILNLNVKITGIDLKKEVIENCNKLAKQLKFKNLYFVYGDVKNFNTEDDIDVVISLHACDTATDIALIKAIRWQAKIILAVPCCQKEIAKQLNSNVFPIMLKHGIIKEKFATLLTDSIRSEVLTACGYNSSVIEFIDEANTPKNILLRCFKQKNNIDLKHLIDIQQYLKSLNVQMYLVEELLK